jgi:hypothetical protein
VPRGSVTTAHNRLQSRGAQMLSVIKRSKAIKISKLLKLPKPSKLLSRLCPEPSLKSLKPTSPLPTPHSLMHSSRAPRVVGALVLSQAPPSGGPHRPTIGFSKRSRWIGVGGGFRSPGHIGFSKRSRWAEAAEGGGGFEGMRGRQ